MSIQIKKYGWLRDYPSLKDYTPEHNRLSIKQKQLGQKDSINKMLNKTGVLNANLNSSSSVDLRKWFSSPVEDQKDIGSCTANAGVGLVEYFEKKAFGKHIDASRLFLYKVTRNLLHLSGDTGAYLRSTMEAMALFGIPPEEYLPYDTNNFDIEPPAFCYSFAQNYQSILYYKLDVNGITPDNLLTRIKDFSNSGLPSMFGFTVFESIHQASRTGKIPFPIDSESVIGGHAIVIAGYDDNMTIKNVGSSVETVGAFLIRNSWGEQWGDHGYGWLPYEYVLKGLAVDFWSILKNEWIDTNNFSV